MKMDLIRVETTLLACLVLVTAFGIVLFVPGQSASAPNIVVTLLNQDPNPARAGDTVDLRFKVENTGDIAASNLNIELVQDYPFTVIDGPAVQKIDRLTAFQSGNNYATLQYTVKIDKDASEGTWQLQLKYINPAGGGSATPNFGISIVNKVFAQISAVDKASLEPGKETEMTFTISNAGSAPLQNMVFSWNDPAGVILPIYSSDTKYVKYLDAGQSVNVTYQVIADVKATAGLYQLNLNLKVESRNTTASTISTKTGVVVGGGTDFDVAFSESSAGQTSLSLANIGNNPAQSVSVSVPRQAAFTVTGASSAIVGNLDKGDYTIVSFQIAQATVGNFSGQQNRQAPTGNFSGVGRQGGGSPAGDNNNNGLRVTISYTDTAGERKSVDKIIPIQFRASAGIPGRGTAAQNNNFVGSTGFWALAIIVVVVAGGVLILRKKGILFKKT